MDTTTQIELIGVGSCLLTNVFRWAGPEYIHRARMDHLFQAAEPLPYHPDRQVGCCPSSFPGHDHAHELWRNFSTHTLELFPVPHLTSLDGRQWPHRPAISEQYVLDNSTVSVHVCAIGRLNSPANVLNLTLIFRGVAELPVTNCKNNDSSSWSRREMKLFGQLITSNRCATPSADNFFIATALPWPKTADVVLNAIQLFLSKVVFIFRCNNRLHFSGTRQLLCCVNRKSRSQPGEPGSYIYIFYLFISELGY